MSEMIIPFTSMLSECSRSRSSSKVFLNTSDVFDLVEMVLSVFFTSNVVFTFVSLNKIKKISM